MTSIHSFTTGATLRQSFLFLPTFVFQMSALATMCALAVVIWIVVVVVRVARLVVLSPTLSSVLFATVGAFGLLLGSTIAGSHHGLLI